MSELHSRPVAGALVGLLLLCACGSAGSATAPGGTGTGGAPGQLYGTGGSAGGAPAGSGATIGGSTGGAASGGAPATGGATGAGGVPIPGDGGATATYTGGASNVAFDWPEAAPGKAGTCVPGKYDGTFTCAFTQSVGCDKNDGTGLPFTGPISITLAQGMSGEFLTVSDGKLDGNSAGFLFGGPITGSLDCTAKKFTGSVAGDYSGLLVINGQVSGPMTSSYDGTVPALTAGHWCMTMTNPGTPKGDPCANIPSGQTGSCLVGSCAGGWTATKGP